MAVLPKAGYSAVELARSFKLSDHNALKRPYDSDLELNIPRFNASAHYNSLIDIFKEMGLNKYTHLDKMGMTDMEKELFAIQKTACRLMKRVPSLPQRLLSEVMIQPYLLLL